MPKVPWLFHQTLARPQEERAVFLVARCAGQPEVQAQVEAMVRAHDAAGRRGNQSRMATHPALTWAARRRRSVWVCPSDRRGASSRP